LQVSGFASFAGQKKGCNQIAAFKDKFIDGGYLI